MSEQGESTVEREGRELGCCQGPEEDVCRLNVAVEDLAVVDVLDGAAELHEPLPDGLLAEKAILLLGEPHPGLQIAALQRDNVSSGCKIQ